MMGLYRLPDKRAGKRLALEAEGTPIAEADLEEMDPSSNEEEGTFESAMQTNNVQQDHEMQDHEASAAVTYQPPLKRAKTGDAASPLDVTIKPHH